VVESLIKAGAFDSFERGRAFLLTNFEKLMSSISADQRERANGQEMLFEMQSSVAGHESRVENRSSKTLTTATVTEFSPDQLLRMEKELLGLYISSHPLERLRESLEAQTTNTVADISDMNEGDPIKVGGLLADCKRIVTKKGDAMMLATLEDLTGSIPLVIFPKAYEKCAPFLNNDEAVIVKGKLNRDFRTEELNVQAETITALEELEKVRSLHVEFVDIKDPSVLNGMKDVLALHRGTDPVFVRTDGKSIELNRDFWVEINPDLVEQLEKLLGDGAVNVEFSVLKKKDAEEALRYSV
jgi:DNA polymerase-3 subunit alpha